MRAAVIGALLLIASMLSCATVTRIAADTRSCAEPQIAERLPALLPVVLAVLDTGSPAVHERAMAALEGGIEGGREVLVCAVDSLLGELEAVKPRAGTGASLKVAAPAPLELRARAYLKDRGFTHRAPLGAS